MAIFHTHSTVVHTPRWTFYWKSNFVQQTKFAPFWKSSLEKNWLLLKTFKEMEDQINAIKILHLFVHFIQSMKITISLLMIKSVKCFFFLHLVEQMIQRSKFLVSGIVV